MTNPTTKAYVGLGSNLGDRAGNLLLAIRGMMEAGFDLNRLSRVYETEPVDTFAQPLFLNMVAALSTNGLSGPEEAMRRLLQVEESLGRIRDVKNGPRTVDLDLLLFGNQTSDTAILKLPHPRFHQRRFVLVPLSELAPTLLHPTLNKTIAELLEELDDVSAVKLWNQ